MARPPQHPAALPSAVLSPVERRQRTDLERAWTVAKWTDARFLDPVVGLLLPGVGDVLGAAAGLYIVVVAVRHGVSRAVVARMLFNLSLDCVGGLVPVVGDLFDFVNRANLRNARLLQQHLGVAPEGRAVGPAQHGDGDGNGNAWRALVLPLAVLAAAVTVALGVTYLAARHWWP
ncbi:MAG: DUF4112 domain-containing protein [Myxococcales bacterium]